MNKEKYRRSKVKRATLRWNPAEDGEFLAGWLNSDGWGYPIEAQQRLKSLLLALSVVREKAQTGLDDIGEAELAPVNELLKQYPWVLEVYSSHPSTTAKRSLLHFQHRPAGPIQQGHTWLRMLIDLMSSGLLDRLRTCANCGCWFYARLPKAKYHSTSCRQAHFRALPTYQEKNKKYQRNYYRDWLSPVTGKYAKDAKKRKQEKRHAKRR